MDNTTEKTSIYRILSCLSMFASALGAACLLCYVNRVSLDMVFCIIILILGMLPVIFFEMLYERNRKQLSNNIKTTYARIAYGFFLCCVVMIIISFFPEFFRPVMLFALIMISFSNESLGIVTSLFLNALLVITTKNNFYEILCFLMMTILVFVLSKALKKKEYRIYICLILAFLNVMFSCVFYYCSNRTLGLKQVLYALFISIIIFLYSYFFFSKELQKTEEEIVYHYEALLSDDFALIKELKSFSMAEYKHARKVSTLARKYAKQLGLNADLAAVGGLYYRLGRLEGEPVVDNGVLLAEKHCFPLPVIEILREYAGEQKLPSTPESALVHMIDASLLKIQLLEEQVGGSKWNREVLIYQTLNEYSTAGLYDKSGLSMNAFLKIRELLAKEELSL